MDGNKKERNTIANIIRHVKYHLYDTYLGTSWKYCIELYFLLDQNGQIFKLVFLKTRLCTYRTFLIPPRAKNILSIHNLVVLYWTIYIYRCSVAFFVWKLWTFFMKNVDIFLWEKSCLWTFYNFFHVCITGYSDNLKVHKYHR